VSRVTLADSLSDFDLTDLFREGRRARRCTSRRPDDGRIYDGRSCDRWWSFSGYFRLPRCQVAHSDERTKDWGKASGLAALARIAPACRFPVI